MNDFHLFISGIITLYTKTLDISAKAYNIYYFEFCFGNSHFFINSILAIINSTYLLFISGARLKSFNKIGNYWKKKEIKWIFNQTLSFLSRHTNVCSYLSHLNWLHMSRTSSIGNRKGIVKIIKLQQIIMFWWKPVIFVFVTTCLLLT